MVEAAAVVTPAADDKSILDGAGKPVPAEKPAGEPKAIPDGDKNPDGSPKTPADPAKPADKPEASKPAGAPEKYEPFKAPEGVTLDPKAIEGFNAVAKELGLSQEGAQKLVDYQTTAIKAAMDDQQKTFNQMQENWKTETRKALGADADKQLAFAAAFRDKFLSDGARKILNDAGLSNHPEIIQAFIKAGKAISEDKYVPGSPAHDKSGKSAAEIIYPNQGK